MRRVILDNKLQEKVLKFRTTWLDLGSIPFHLHVTVEGFHCLIASSTKKSIITKHVIIDFPPFLMKGWVAPFMRGPPPKHPTIISYPTIHSLLSGHPPTWKIIFKIGAKLLYPAFPIVCTNISLYTSHSIRLYTTVRVSIKGF